MYVAITTVYVCVFTVYLLTSCYWPLTDLCTYLAIYYLCISTGFMYICIQHNNEAAAKASCMTVHVHYVCSC